VDYCRRKWIQQIRYASVFTSNSIHSKFHIIVEYVRIRINKSFGELCQLTKIEKIKCNSKSFSGGPYAILDIYMFNYFLAHVGTIDIKKIFWMTSPKWNLDAHFDLSHFKPLDARIFCMEETTCLASWMTHKWRHSRIGILYVNFLIKGLELLIDKVSSCNNVSFILLSRYQKEKKRFSNSRKLDLHQNLNCCWREARDVYKGTVEARELAKVRHWFLHKYSHFF